MAALSQSRRIAYVLKHNFTLPTPPQNLINDVGGGDFHAVGEHFMMIFQDHCDLAPNANVLDIGSGCGRMALPLTRYLLPESEYCGFDIMAPLVDWCKEHITPRFPNFRFHHAQLENTWYSQKGEDASQYRFPYEDNKFDFVFATSVFTHLKPASGSNYMKELHRVMKPGGVALTTWFLLSRDNQDWGFAGDSPIYRVADREHPEVTTAYDETYVLQALREVGQKIDQISYGIWNGRKGLSYQDIIVSSKDA